MSFAYCLNTSTIRHESLSILEAIDIAAAAGYDGIEPWVRELDAFVADGGSLAEVRGRAAARELRIVNLIAFFEWPVPEAERRRAGLDEARRCFDMADALDCPFVAAPPFGIHQRQVDLLPVAQRYADLVAAVDGFAAKPLLEFWGAAQTLGTLGEALLVAAESGLNDVQLLADVYHLYKGSGHFAGLDYLRPGTLALMHVNDVPAGADRAALTDADRVYPGDGVAPWPSLVRQLENLGYTGMLSLELFNPTYWTQGPVAAAETGLARLKACVEAV